MKTAEPKIIYLQIGEDVDISELKDYEFETNAITWCWERIFPNDIEYVSKQSITGMIDEMIKENQAFFGDYTIKTLTELKQKIEEL